MSESTHLREHVKTILNTTRIELQLQVQRQGWDRSTERDVMRLIDIRFNLEISTLKKMSLAQLQKFKRALGRK